MSIRQLNEALITIRDRYNTVLGSIERLEDDVEDCLKLIEDFKTQIDSNRQYIEAKKAVLVELDRQRQLIYAIKKNRSDRKPV